MQARVERIALTKVPGGSIRSAELETAPGQGFWSVYVAKPGSKNAKNFIPLQELEGRPPVFVQSSNLAVDGEAFRLQRFEGVDQDWIIVVEALPVA